MDYKGMDEKQACSTGGERKRKGGEKERDLAQSGHSTATANAGLSGLTAMLTPKTWGELQRWNVV